MRYSLILAVAVILVAGCTSFHEKPGFQETITAIKKLPMVLIPAGEFSMGSENSSPAQKPVHQVYLDDYYLDKYEVTNIRYSGCVMVGKCKRPTNDIEFSDPTLADYPVVFVDWSMAQTYCYWRGGRLPSEAEWEKAARGTDGRIYPWGNNWIFDCVPANFGGCNDSAKPVGSYPAGVSPYGIFEMAGNVWEWTGDWYAENYYASLLPLSTNPTGPKTGFERVVRGGSWISFHAYLENPNRDKFDPIRAIATIGFRCAQSP
jgi:formylglycine-generating enzyme required for sulfatase activity